MANDNPVIVFCLQILSAQRLVPLLVFLIQYAMFTLKTIQKTWIPATILMTVHNTDDSAVNQVYEYVYEIYEKV